MAGLLGWLLLYRVLARFVGMRGRLSLGWVAGLTVAAALGTALGEATFTHLAYHAPPLLGAADECDSHRRITAGAHRACGRACGDARRHLARCAAERAPPLAPGMNRNGYGTPRRGNQFIGWTGRDGYR